MKFSLVLTLFTISTFFSYAQPTYNWVRVFGSLTGSPFELCYEHTTDNHGSVYSVGAFMNTGNFDPGFSNTSYQSSGNADAYISKYDSTGAYIWTITFGNAFTDIALSVTYDGDSAIYVTGTFNGIVDFDPDTSQFILDGIHVQNIFLAKYTLDGKLIWAFVVNGSSLGNCVYSDRNGGIYLTGGYRNATDFDPGPGLAWVPSVSNLTRNIFLAKYNDSGNFQWLIYGGGDADDYSQQITFSENNIYWTGAMSENTELNTPTSQFSFSGNGNRDIFIVKADPVSGEIKQSVLMGGTEDDFSGGIAVKENRVYTTGKFQGSSDFDNSPTSFILNSNGGDDVFVAAYDTSFNFISAKSFGDVTNDDSGSSIAIDQNNHIVVAGDFLGTANFDLNGGSNQLSSSPSNYSGFIAKYDSMFQCIWAFSPAGGVSHITSVSNQNDRIWVSGVSGGMVDFDPSPAISGQVVSLATSFTANYFDTDLNSIYDNSSSVESRLKILSASIIDQKFQIKVASDQTGEFLLKLYNLTGALYYETKLYLQSGVHSYVLKDTMTGSNFNIVIISGENGISGKKFLGW